MVAVRAASQSAVVGRGREGEGQSSVAFWTVRTYAISRSADANEMMRHAKAARARTQIQLERIKLCQELSKCSKTQRWAFVVMSEEGTSERARGSAGCEGAERAVGFCI